MWSGPSVSECDKLQGAPRESPRSQLIAPCWRHRSNRVPQSHTPSPNLARSHHRRRFSSAWGEGCAENEHHAREKQNTREKRTNRLHSKDQTYHTSNNTKTEAKNQAHSPVGLTRNKTELAFWEWYALRYLSSVSPSPRCSLPPGRAPATGISTRRTPFPSRS